MQINWISQKRWCDFLVWFELKKLHAKQKLIYCIFSLTQKRCCFLIFLKSDNIGVINVSVPLLTDFTADLEYIIKT